MPRHMDPSKRDYVVRFYPVEPPENILEWETWTGYNVCIPRPLMPYLLGLMRVYQWEGRVKTDDPAKATSFVQAWNDLIARMGAAEDCMPFPILRQNPANPCQMQQSLDGGSTWTTVFDSSVCQPTMPAPAPPMIRLRQNSTSPKLLEQSIDGGSTWTTAYDFSKYRSVTQVLQEVTTYNNSQTEINNYNQEWNNNPTVNYFAPNMVYDGTNTPANAQRDKAICYAIGVWYDAVKGAAVAYAANQNDAWIAFSSGLVGAIGSLATPVVGFVAAAIVGALQKGISLLGAASQEGAYTEAKADILCCMYEGLKGETLTEARFQAAVSSCGFTPGSNIEAIRVLINALLQDRSVYLSFLKFANEGFSYAEFAELPDCPCEEPTTWSRVWDFTVSSAGWTPTVGLYVSGSGYQSDGVGAFPYTIDLKINPTWPSGSALTHASIEATSSVADSGAFRGIYFMPNGVFQNQGGAATGNYTLEIDTSVSQPAEIHVQVSNSSVAGSNTIRRITLSGTGTEPTW